MNEVIKICGHEEDAYTAKEVMRQIVAHMKQKVDHAIMVITLGGDSWDSEGVLFVKMFWRFLHKSRDRVLLLAENERRFSELENYMEENNVQVSVVERVNLEEQGASPDMVLNCINGAEAECIIASLSTEAEEGFLEKYRNSLDAKIWFGIGIQLKQKSNMSKMREFWKNIFRKKYRKTE